MEKVVADEESELLVVINHYTLKIDYLYQLDLPVDDSHWKGFVDETEVQYCYLQDYYSAGFYKVSVL